MADIAQLSFHSADRPEEQGALILGDDGRVRIEPSRTFRDAMARREETALDRAETFGTRLGLGLIALGTLAVTAGWYAGRVFGKWAYTVTRPRSLRDVALTRGEDGVLRLRMPDGVRMEWQAGDFLESEAEQFLLAVEEMRV